uniref:Uncharacterized protein n=1 Tax=Labrus bergylta TaxID=56723 RepID=A0A3Q3N5K3_9LABR
IWREKMSILVFLSTRPTACTHIYSERTSTRPTACTHIYTERTSTRPTACTHIYSERTSTRPTACTHIYSERTSTRPTACTHIYSVRTSTRPTACTHIYSVMTSTRPVIQTSEACYQESLLECKCTNLGHFAQVLLSLCHGHLRTRLHTSVISLLECDVIFVTCRCNGSRKWT